MPHTNDKTEEDMTSAHCSVCKKDMQEEMHVPTTFNAEDFKSGEQEEEIEKVKDTIKFICGYPYGDEEIKETLRSLLARTRKEAHQNLFPDTIRYYIEEAVQKHEEKIKLALQEERQFILNILDGIDIADKEAGNTGGGTEAIRLALKNRII